MCSPAFLIIDFFLQLPISLSLKTVYSSPSPLVLTTFFSALRSPAVAPILVSLSAPT